MAYYKGFIISCYSLVTFGIFYKIYETSKMIVDEEFHLRQGLHYCNGNFTIWDPKITTFPGLYLVSTLLFLPIGACNVFALRLTSVFASVVNLWFIYEIRRLATGRKATSEIKTAFEGLTIALLPPMYFFAHLYYTDIISITTVLGLILFNMKHEHHIASLFGLASVIMRQTNIVWVGFALGTTVMDKFVSQTMPFIKSSTQKPNVKTDQYFCYTFKEMLMVVGFYCKRFYLIPKQIKLLAFYLIGYIAVILLFITFVLINGSIVIGDKSAHEASVHLPQIMYFTLFWLIFSSSHALANLYETMSTIIQRWYIYLLSICICLTIVHYNTLVHPYLLADNRHYIFYIWNRFYGKYFWARYAIVPIYVYALTSINHTLLNKSAGFKTMLTICVVAVCAFQKLLELRYFIIPYLLIRLNANDIKWRYLFIEFIIYTLINFGTLSIFFNYEIKWNDYKDVQRFMW